MLYIFWVEKGTIIRLNVDVAVDTVLNLKTTLINHTHIPEVSQVLLINGGEPLDDRSRVAKYQSGTDTNPIFLFNRDAIESERQPDLTSDSFQAVPDEEEAKVAVEAVLSLPVSFNSVVTRTQLAQQYYDFAKELNRQCSILVQEQHLQHQGWQAVMANLDDVVSAFRKRLEKFQIAYKAYLDSRNDKLQNLMSFGDNVEVLSKIPLFPALVRPKRAKTSRSLETVSEPSTESESKKIPDDVSSVDDEITIIDWISAKDSDHDLLSVADGCRRTIETFDDSTLEDVVKDSQVVIGLCNNPSMKEIKGLAERLFSLDGLLTEAKKLVLEQKETSDVLCKMQQQVTSRDVQLIKDLAVSFTQYLHQVMKIHSKLCSIKKRCLNAKQELCNHLQVRLSWVVKVENGISEVDDKVRIYFENIKRIKRLTHMLEQVRNVPLVYLSAVEEVLRRRHYAQDFITWATTVAKTASQSYLEESEARKSFLSAYGSHFLCSLFPGLEQFPPQFATNPPVEFDSSLPPLNETDLRQLLDRVPSLSDKLKSPVKEAASQLVPCPLTCTVSSPAEEPESSSPRNRRVSFHSDSTEVAALLQAYPSITCTVQERQLLDSLPRTVLTYRTVLLTLQTAHQNLKADLLRLADLFRTSVLEGHNQVQIELAKERQQRREVERRLTDAKDNLEESQITIEELDGKVDRLKDENNEIQRAKSETERELASYQDKNAEREENSTKSMEELNQMKEEVYRWKEETQKREEEKDAEIARLKAALVGSTLEKNQLKDQLQERASQYERAMEKAEIEKKLAVELERERLLSENLPEVSNPEPLSPVPSASVGLQFPEESSTESPTNETTFTDQQQYQQEPISPRSDSFFPIHPPLPRPSPLPRVYTESMLVTHDPPDSMESSVSVQSQQHNLMEMSFMSGVQQTTLSGPLASSPRPTQLGGSAGMYSTFITLTSCNPAELVLFVYHKDFKQYTAYLPFKRSLYLLHSDSHTDLGLVPIRGPEGELMEVRSWVVAEIVGKEYVLTKKEPNRYRLKEGTRFYRVKAKAWDLENILREAAASGAAQPSSSLLP